MEHLTRSERIVMRQSVMRLCTLVKLSVGVPGISVSWVCYNVGPKGEYMDIIAQLKIERDKATQQVNALDMAIEALSGTTTSKGSQGRRTMSAAARGRISAAQKARWARTRGKVVSIAKRKRHISAAGLARIRAATRARWARWRAQK